MARIIIIPPIVGVPFFCCSPANPRSLTLSPHCLFCKNFITFFPKSVDITKERINASKTLKVINWKSPPPGNRIPSFASH